MSLNSVYAGFTKNPPSITFGVQRKKLLSEKELLRCVGQTIRDARKRKAMTQERLSEIAGVSAKYLSEVERGQSNVTILFLSRVARALGVDMSALLCGCDDPSDERRLRRGIWDQLQELKQQELRQAGRILRAISGGEDGNDHNEAEKNFGSDFERRAR